MRNMMSWTYGTLTQLWGFAQAHPSLIRAAFNLNRSGGIADAITFIRRFYGSHEK